MGRPLLALTFGVAILLSAGNVLAEEPVKPDPASQAAARQILEATGVQGGLIVHLGCGDGRLTAALHASDSYLVQGLDTDAANVAKARKYVLDRGLYGKVTVDRLAGPRLPLIDNLANLIVAESLGDVSKAEVMRALCPGGVAYLKRGNTWEKTVEPRPTNIDEWTHYLHDSSNNAVAKDTVIGPPRGLQWVGSPRYGRHHDRMSSVSAAVSTKSRVFYIIDEGSRKSIITPPHWTLVARDAFNGT
ncbi:MAG: class I SAM-dependent methyltransferase, partial [Pirellulales bacterium]|nr:class I SAM-dependent methyltransferase [Pirellulales bacterium]